MRGRGWCHTGCCVRVFEAVREEEIKIKSTLHNHTQPGMMLIVILCWGERWGDRERSVFQGKETHCHTGVTDGGSGELFF